MRAAHFQNNQIRLQTQDRPVPGAGEALIRVDMAGICGTDLEILAGYAQFTGIPGHEFVGHVLQAKDQPDLIGQRVVADINIGCKTCSWCLQGNHRHCQKRQVIGIRDRDGAFAHYLCCPLPNLIPVPPDLDNKQAVMAEPLAAALEVSQQVHLTAQTRVAVLGDGKLGLLCALALRHFAPDLHLIGRHASKLQVAQAQGVATYHLQGPDQDTIPGAQNFDCVVDCTGRADGLDTALKLVRPEGIVVLKTTSHQPTTLDMSLVVVKEVTLLGSRCGDMHLALHFLDMGWVDVLPLIDSVFPLTHLHEALNRAAQSGALKVLVDCRE